MKEAKRKFQVVSFTHPPGWWLVAHRSFPLLARACAVSEKGKWHCYPLSLLLLSPSSFCLFCSLFLVWLVDTHALPAPAAWTRLIRGKRRKKKSRRRTMGMKIRNKNKRWNKGQEWKLHRQAPLPATTTASRSNTRRRRKKRRLLICRIYNVIRSKRPISCCHAPLGAATPLMHPSL